MPVSEQVPALVFAFLAPSLQIKPLLGLLFLKIMGWVKYWTIWLGKEKGYILSIILALCLCSYVYVRIRFARMPPQQCLGRG